MKFLFELAVPTCFPKCYFWLREESRWGFAQATLLEVRDKKEKKKKKQLWKTSLPFVCMVSPPANLSPSYLLLVNCSGSSWEDQIYAQGNLSETTLSFSPIPERAGIEAVVKIVMWEGHAFNTETMVNTRHGPCPDILLAMQAPLSFCTLLESSGQDCYEVIPDRMLWTPASKRPNKPNPVMS